MKSSKAEIHAKFHGIPVIRFEDQKPTSFSGLLIFQVLFRRLNLREYLKKCFDHLKGPADALVGNFGWPQSGYVFSTIEHAP